MKRVLISTAIILLLPTITARLDIPRIDVESNQPQVAEYKEIKGTFSRGETIFDIFKRYNLAIEELYQMREASAGVHRLRKVNPGREYKIILDEKDRINTFIYWIDDDNYLNITRAESGFSAEKASVDYEKRVMHIGGTIKNNLISSVGEGRENLMLALQITDILSWDIDFTTDLRENDDYKIVVEGLYLDGEFKKFGDILTVEFINNGKTFLAYRFENEGRADYYDEEGRSVRKAFLKAPLSFRRISSGFSKGRFHPILKKYRPHHGLDYAAPTGTPVSAIGSGTILFAGVKGSYGNLVIIKHPNGYKTYYGHLSRIRSGIRRGVKVDQGQLIGNVGATGRTTGPHLHYELRINDKPVNPLTVELPRGQPVPDKLLADFMQAKSQLDEQLAHIKNSVIVSKLF